MSFASVTGFVSDSTGLPFDREVAPAMHCSRKILPSHHPPHASHLLAPNSLFLNVNVPSARRPETLGALLVPTPAGKRCTNCWGWDCIISVHYYVGFVNIGLAIPLGWQNFRAVLLRWFSWCSKSFRTPPSSQDRTSQTFCRQPGFFSFARVLLLLTIFTSILAILFILYLRSSINSSISSSNSRSISGICQNLRHPHHIITNLTSHE